MRRLGLLAAARQAAHLLARTPARRLLHTSLVARLRIAAGREMSAEAVAEVSRCLDAHEIRHWLCGGWGVDALAGRQTRRHGDLDVIIDGADPRLPGGADAALAEIGLRRVATETSIAPMSTIWVFSDGRSRTVDLLPVDVTTAPFDHPDAWAQGRIAGAAVRCISAALQRRLRAGYAPRSSDRADLAVLDGLASS